MRGNRVARRWSAPCHPACARARRGQAGAMDDEAITPEQKARNRRLFGDVIGWLLLRDRRPGMIGAAVGLRGKSSKGPVELSRLGDHDWRLMDEGESQVTTAEVLHLVGTGAFFPTTVDVVPDLAEMLFMEAVHQAETSLSRVRSAAEHLASARQDDKDIVAFVLVQTELDRAVRASIASIVLAVAAGEAQVNRWGEERGGWSQYEDRLGLGRKCAALAARVGRPVSLGTRPYQQLQQAVRRRNALVHSRPVAEQVPATGEKVPVPGRSMSVEARSTCLVVRRSFVDLAQRLDVPPPPYLAYCPPAEPDDDGAWNGASVMTGVRPDPDFPPIANRHPGAANDA